MKKVLLFVGLFLVSFTSFSQDTIRVKNQIFEVLYSQKLESPLWLKYRSTNRPTNVNRGTMDFYTEKNIKTSDGEDYKANIYDKGHLAPAASFSCNEGMLYETFSYLNSALQHQGLNRGQWSKLEAFERAAANFFDVDVKVRVDVLFEGEEVVLPSGATIPSGFRKTITIGNKTRVFEFPNEDTKGTKWIDYIIK